jgi:hypothetical protein
MPDLDERRDRRIWRLQKRHMRLNILGDPDRTVLQLVHFLHEDRRAPKNRGL